MDTLTSIRVFRQVVESGSFVAAADRLDMSTAMVSKHVMNVERRLGIRLLNRNTRALSLTESGKAYFERTKGILEDLQQIELELSSQSAIPRGTLRVSCPSFFASLQNMANYLAEYRRLYPDVLVDVSFEDRNVDLAEEGYDVALRITSDAASLPRALSGRPVRPIYFVLGASREYLEHRGVPKSPEDLGEHEFVGVGNFESIHLKGPGGLREVPIRVVMRYRSTVGVANTVAAGIGIASLPSTFFEDPVLRERLVPVLTQCPLRETTLYAVYVSRKFVPLKIRSFVDFVLDRFKVPTAVGDRTESIFQMFTRFGGAGFFVRRNSWSHPRTAARVISVGGLTSGPLPGSPPYHQPPGAKKLIAMGAISYRGEPAKIEELTGPGTFAYTLIERPEWWAD